MIVLPSTPAAGAVMVSLSTEQQSAIDGALLSLTQQMEELHRIQLLAQHGASVDKCQLQQVLALLHLVPKELGNTLKAPIDALVEGPSVSRMPATSEAFRQWWLTHGVGLVSRIQFTEKGHMQVSVSHVFTDAIPHYQEAQAVAYTQELQALQAEGLVILRTSAEPSAAGLVLATPATLACLTRLLQRKAPCAVISSYTTRALSASETQHLSCAQSLDDSPPMALASFDVLVTDPLELLR